MKDDQVEVLRSLIVNLESHIEKLNAEMKLKEHTGLLSKFKIQHGVHLINFICF